MHAIKTAGIYENTNKFRYHTMCPVIRVGLENNQSLAVKIHSYRSDSHALNKHAGEMAPMATQT